jgi:hypothetical protein
MSWIQYEVWGVLDGREEVIDTTPSLKEAELLAAGELDLWDEVIIYEDKDGDELVEVRRLQGL